MSSVTVLLLMGLARQAGASFRGVTEVQREVRVRIKNQIPLRIREYEYLGTSKVR